MGVPQEWIGDGEYSAAFICNQTLYHVTENSVVKSKAPKERIAGRNKIHSSSPVHDKVITLSEDDSLNVFVKDEQDNQKPFTMLFCLGHICPDCGAVSQDSCHHQRHMKQHIDLVKCPKCPPDTEAMDKVLLRKHMKQCVIKCPYDGCDSVMQTRIKLSAHIRKHVRSLA